MSEFPRLDGPMAPPASGAHARSIVILLHGYGSNGADLIGLAPYWRHLLPDTVFHAPNAPQPCPGAPGGYQWWALTNGEGGRAAGVRQPAPALNAFIDAKLAQHGLTEDRLALVGFSQGTMMALHIAPRRARALAGVVGYSGRLVDPEELSTEVRTRAPVLLVHGDADPMVPFAALDEAATAMTALGFDVATHASAGLGHSIDAAGLELGGAFLARVLSDSSSETLR